MSQRIFLVGLPGAGKTTLGMELANDLGIPFIDLDLEIEKYEKQTIRTIFSEKGEAHFRQLEQLYLKKVINESDTFVMATGGGTPCFFDNMNLMKSEGKTIYIETPINLIKSRLQHDTSRPLMQSNTLESLLESREKWYLMADKTVTSYEELLDHIKS